MEMKISEYLRIRFLFLNLLGGELIPEEKQFITYEKR